jgi:hypothetical protein
MAVQKRCDEISVLKSGLEWCTCSGRLAWNIKSGTQLTEEGLFDAVALYRAIIVHALIGCVRGWSLL